MDIRAITPDYAVSPQIEPADLPAIKAAGYVTVIDNRPDSEIPPPLHTAAMRAAAEALGLRFVANPVIGGMLTMDNVTAQAAAIAASPGPVFAYCASGNRSSIVWALANAGKRPVDELVGLPARFGYQLDHLRPQIEALARSHGTQSGDQGTPGRL
ncbi:MAG: TIGR01244 family sulfur transferase [Tabrizicola sp.]